MPQPNPDEGAGTGPYGSYCSLKARVVRRPAVALTSGGGDAAGSAGEPTACHRYKTSTTRVHTYTVTHGAAAPARLATPGTQQHCHTRSARQSQDKLRNVMAEHGTTTLVKRPDRRASQRGAADGPVWPL